MKDVRSTIEVPEIIVVTVGESGPRGIQGESGGETQEYTASEAMSAYRVVVIDGDTAVRLASNLNAAHRSVVLGITETAAAALGTVRVRRIGKIENAVWAWAPFEPVFVGAAGVLTQTPPAAPAVFSQIIAMAMSATALFVWPRESMTL